MRTPTSGRASRAARRTRPIHLAVVGCAVVLTGCFRVLPVAPEQLSPSVQVQVQLGPGAAAEVEPVLGSRGRLLTGRIMEVAPDGVVVRVRTTFPGAGTHDRPLFQEVRIDRRELLGIQRRELDRGMTGLVVAGAGAAIAALLVAAFGGEAGGADLPPDGGAAAEARLPPLPRFAR